MMIAVLGEHDSDAQTIRMILKRKIGAQVRITPKGFGGCDALCRKGARVIKNLAERGYTHFFVCHDADCPDPEIARAKVDREVVIPSGAANSCITIPVQEIEAWIIADESAIARTIPSFQPREVPRPETIKWPRSAPLFSG
jgi:hypothetical protein